MLEGVPMPNTQHSDFDNIVNSIRSRHAKGVIRGLIQIKELDPPLAIQLDYEGYHNVAAEKRETTLQMRTSSLWRQEACAPAPFVGDPMWETYMYFWDFYSERDSGRWIAMDTRLVHHMYDRPLDHEERSARIAEEGQRLRA